MSVHDTSVLVYVSCICNCIVLYVRCNAIMKPYDAVADGREVSLFVLPVYLSYNVVVVVVVVVDAYTVLVFSIT